MERGYLCRFLSLEEGRRVQSSRGPHLCFSCTINWFSVCGKPGWGKTRSTQRVAPSSDPGLAGGRSLQAELALSRVRWLWGSGYRGLGGPLSFPTNTGLKFYLCEDALEDSRCCIDRTGSRPWRGSTWLNTDRLSIEKNDYRQWNHACDFVSS